MELFIFAATIVLMIVALLFFPTLKLKNHTIETYWLVVLFGALLLILSDSIDLSLLWASLTSDANMNPIKLVILFIMMTVLSLFLDEVGFFKWLALYLVRKVKGKQIALFFVIYAMVSILTIFTSNDVIILTLTPLICYFASNAKINPLPYLFGVLTAANTWSIMLIIGNPTNIYLAVNQGIDFITYFQAMWFPGLIAGITGLIMVYLLFHRDLNKPMTIIEEEFKLPNLFLAILGVVSIISTIILLAISNFIGLEMWLIVLSMAIILTIISLIYLLVKKKSISPIINTYKKAPWSFIPLILGMFVLVEGIKQGHFITSLVTLLDKGNPIYTYGISSYLFSNLMNNQPMSMLFSVMLEQVSISSVRMATYASIIGSNIGVLLTPLGALAGLMWMNLLHKQNIELSFFGYIKKGALIGIVALLSSLTALLLVM